MGLYDYTVYEMIKVNAESYGKKPAWFEADTGREATFLQIKEEVDRLAAGLKGKGITKGDRIAVLGKNSLEYFLIYGAAAALGAIVLPVNWRLSEEEIVYILNDCQPKIIFADSDYHTFMENSEKKTAFIELFFSLDSDAKNYPGIATLLENDAQIEPEEISAHDDFIIIHTAAAAGRPRGALLSHGNMLTASLHLGYGLDIRSRDVHLNLLPLFHVGGLFMAAGAFHAGALNINMRKFEADKAVDLIGEKKVSLLFDFSPILSSVMEEHEKSGKDISSLKKVVGLDTPENIEKYQELTGGTFYTLYGQTETSALVTMGEYNNRPGSAGKAIHLAEIRLVDDYDNNVERGGTGEICVRGPMVFKGYWNLPEDTEYTFREGWHHTGDLGRFDEDGFLWYAGRKAEKELIKPGGENVYPAEVEKVLLQHTAVEQAVVFGVPDPKWKEGIKAVLVLKENGSFNPSYFIDFVGSKVARYKKPHYVEFAEELPVKSDGSIDREKVKELYGGEQA
jgi:long-chain acyl-CoA synthetase